MSKRHRPKGHKRIKNAKLNVQQDKHIKRKHRRLLKRIERSQEKEYFVFPPDSIGIGKR